ncbi:helix-turn-helix transcriptional regulator [Paenibacillus tritici]|uniref:AraC family transcriptional regulator n=1 Tax=Paenibacillus tritici TaxID=1873425 RepID=UPI001BA701F2|nr:AraC family transcriptional regulator [Paenibacillus tritici]QUL53408.1 helix-turn-helix transcriptional regulator [Paenibacillus tritici]
MKRLFEPVHRLQSGFWWDYGIRVEQNYKGYYHWHQCCEFILVHEGEGTVVVGQKTFGIKRGMFFLFMPYQLHQVYAEVSPEKPYIRSIFYIDLLLVEECLRSFPSLSGRFEQVLIASSENHVYELDAPTVVTLEELYARYDASSRSGQAGKTEAIALLLIQLFCWLPQESLREDSAERKAKRPIRYAETVMRWIETHFAEENIMEQLAEITHLTPNYLSRIFRQETGSSITDYLIAKRIRKACWMLEMTVLAVEQIGQEIGYANTSYFIHLFKKETGMTPLKYRSSLH